MAQQANLQVATRSTPARARPAPSAAQGKVPGVIYGHDRAPEALTVDNLPRSPRCWSGISAATTIVDVAIDGRAAGQGADPRDPARLRSAPPRSSISTSTRSGPTRR